MRMQHLVVRDKALLPWAAGLVIGEGCIGAERSRKWRYFTLQLGMCDERAVRKFARLFGILVTRLILKHTAKPFYKIYIRGRTAEQVVAALWPWLKGTDKGDQALRRAKELGLTAWIIGRKKGVRPEVKDNHRGRPKKCA